MIASRSVDTQQCFIQPYESSIYLVSGTANAWLKLATPKPSQGDVMIGSVRPFFRTASLILLVATGVLVQGSDVQATLLGTSVTANLTSPVDSNLDLTDNVTVGSGIEIQSGDGSNIGSAMFTSIDANSVGVPEYIDIFDTGVILRIAGADVDGNDTDGYMTGFSAGAKYVFSGLSASITGIDSILLSPNISSFSNVAGSPGCTAGICFDSGTLTVFLDAMVIGPDGNLPAPMGLVTINLTASTQPPPPNGAPEPATLMLLAAGLVGLGVSRGRRIQRSA